ncbi:MAG: ATP-dependent helicase HrpB [Cyanobacteriota bacterium]
MAVQSIRSASAGAEPALPIDPHLPSIVQGLPPGGTLLLQAPPGAGKTTRVPLALLRHLAPEQGTILMLEPRRLAARAAASRLAACLGEEVGDQVGYRVRLEQRCSATTRLEVVTDGIFLRRLQADPGLSGVACVILDEFHERRAEADLALALLREARSVLHPELRLLVMSATLNLAPLTASLHDATVVTSAGRSHPVTIHHQAPRPEEALGRQVLRALEQHWLDQRGERESVLVFLPGQREISQVQRLLESTPWAADLEITPLHGQLNLDEQSQAIQTARHRAGKVVRATAVAESSLTIEGVTLVVDSGLSRRNRFDPGTRMNGLVTVPASAASAEQRSGRAGRLGPGRAIRLWSPAERQRRPDFDPPELLDSDPLPLALQLAEWGAGLGEGLSWIDPPPAAGLKEARQLLMQLQALDPEGRINAHGRSMARLGVHPRLAHMLLWAEARGLFPLAADLAVLLSERDPLRPQEVGVDLLARLDWLQRGGRHPVQQLARRQQQQWRRQLREGRTPLELPETESSPLSAPAAVNQAAVAGTVSEWAAAELLSWAFPERLALARDPDSGRYLLRQGRGAILPAGDPLIGTEALVVARADGEGQNARIQLALRCPRQLLETRAAAEGRWREVVSWEDSQQRVRCERELRLDALVLAREPWTGSEAGVIRDTLLGAVCDRGLDVLPWSTGTRQLQQRLSLLHEQLGSPWPDRRDQTLNAELSSWLAPWLEGMDSLQDLRRLDLKELLWGDRPWELRMQLEELLPQTLEIPSGRLATIDYSGGTPVLAVKLQEMFGCLETPTVLKGRLAITVELLSPANRPVAITRDLKSFWASGYGEVRRELRGRYPRHPWPEDPGNARATALTNQRLQQQQGWS